MGLEGLYGWGWRGWVDSRCGWGWGWGLTDHSHYPGRRYSFSPTHVGASGGEEGALNGPSIMPGG